MEEFLHMLELIIPGKMFHNASEHFKNSMLNIIYYYYTLTKHIHLFFKRCVFYSNGLYSIYTLGPKSHLRKTAKKHPLSRKTIQKFHESTIWQMENELYTFVAREFAFAYVKQFPNSPSILNGSMRKHLKSGGYIPPPSFRYEKIYPKPAQFQKKKKSSNHV